MVAIFVWNGRPSNPPAEGQAQTGESSLTGSVNPDAITDNARRVRLEADDLHDRIRTAARRSTRIAENAAEPVHPFPHVPRTREGMSLEEDPFGANSEAEQAWLDRHGYPNALQLQEYTSASDEQLLAAAEAGDEVARTLLDFREFERGSESAENALLHAGATGNSYALELLSSWHSGSEYGDPIFGHALSKVLEWQGNYQISLLRNMGMRTPLSEADRILAEAEALMIFNQFRELLQEMGDPSPPVDPRPGAG